MLSCVPVPASAQGQSAGPYPEQPQRPASAQVESAGPDPEQPQRPLSAASSELDGIVAWCHQQIVEQHLRAELQVIGSLLACAHPQRYKQDTDHTCTLESTFDSVLT